MYKYMCMVSQYTYYHIVQTRKIGGGGSRYTGRCSDSTFHGNYNYDYRNHPSTPIEKQPRSL